VRISTEYQFCRKCNKQLHYVTPGMSQLPTAHFGTDYWTQHGERRWKPRICMACRSKVGAKAQLAQRKAMYEVTKQAFQSTPKQTTLED